MASPCRRFVAGGTTTAALVVVVGGGGGCSTHQADCGDDEYFLLHDGVYYPAEDGLPYDADVNRYSHRERSYYMKQPDPLHPGAGSAQDHRR